MPITPQQARAELARRELARRGVPLEQPQRAIQSQQPIQEQPQRPKPFWSAFGAEITPQMRQQAPIPSAIAQTAQDVFATPAAFFNQFLLNYPRYLTEKTGYKYPTGGETMGGKIGYGAGGIAGAIESPITRAITGLFGLGRIPTSISQAAGAGVPLTQRLGQLIPTSMRLGEKVLRGAGAGATLGGLYGQPMAQRPISAIGGGILGAGTELVGAGIKETVKAFRKAKAPAKLQPTQRISLAQVEARQKYGKPIEEARLAQQKLNWEKQDTRQIVNERIRQTNLAMKQSIAQIDDEITKSAEKGSVAFQEKLPEFFKANSRTYGDRLDEISEALANSKRGSITKGDLNNIIENTIFEVQQTGISQGQPNVYLSMLNQKYALKQELDNFGNIITDANTPIDFKQAVYDIRSIWKTISGQAKQGKFTDNDIVASFLKKNWGEWIGQYAPELQELNTSYRPVIQAMKESARIFKPAQGELATKTAENFLARLGKGKLSGGERKLLGMIEQGTEFAPGVGQISQGIEELGAKRVTTIAKQELNRASLQQALSERMAKFEQQGRQTAEIINKNRQLLQNRLQSLGARKEDIMKLMANRDKGRAIRKALLYTGLTLGATTIPYSIQRLLYRVRTNE